MTRLLCVVCLTPGPPVESGEPDQFNAGPELFPVLPRGGPLPVLHHLLPQHGTQPHQQDSLRNLFPGQSAEQAKHEGKWPALAQR